MSWGDGPQPDRVLLRQGERWEVQAIERSVRLQREESWEPSKNILKQIVEQKRTFWKPLPNASSEHSLFLMDTVVAAPILDRGGHVIGALCVIDMVPRSFDDKECEMLKRIAAEFMAKVEALPHPREKQPLTS